MIARGTCHVCFAFLAAAKVDLERAQAITRARRRELLELVIIVLVGLEVQWGRLFGRLRDSLAGGAAGAS